MKTENDHLSLPWWCSVGAQVWGGTLSDSCDSSSFLYIFIYILTGIMFVAIKSVNNRFGLT